MDVTCLVREGLGPSWTVVNISSVYIYFRALLGCTAVLWWGAIPGRLCWVVTFVDLQCHGGIHGWVSLLGAIAGRHGWVAVFGHIVLTDKSNPMAPCRFRTHLHCFGKSAVWSWSTHMWLVC